MKDHGSHLLSGRLLASSAIWSLAAQALPAVVGVVTIPFIIRGLGVDRFGVLTLAWMVIGYFSLFDLGLGRAVTKVAAEVLASERRAGVDSLVWTAWYLMLALGIGGATLLSILTPWLVGRVVKIPAALQPETLQSFYLLAWSIPVVVLTTGFRGVLEAAQHFKLTSVVRIPMGVLTFVTPLFVLYFTKDLAVIVLALIVVRLAGAAVYAIMCHQVVHIRGVPATLDRESARTLLQFGAWMTVSNVVSPLMMNVDRFFVGAILSVAAVAYYATPYEAVTKLLIFPSAIAAVLFPAFSTASVINRDRMVTLYWTGFQAVFLTMYPIIVVVVAFAPDLLRIWLGGDFAAQSAIPLRWLAVGVLANSLASIPFAFLQGIGRSDTTARIHLVEAPLYFALMIWLIHRRGIAGAAVAWSARTTLDLAVLYWQAGKHVRGPRTEWSRTATAVAVLAALLVCAAYPTTTLVKVIFVIALLMSVATVAWTKRTAWAR